MKLSLRQWRNVREISQEAMALKLGIHVNTYQNWEKEPGKIGISNAVKISEILNVPIEDINFNATSNLEEVV